MRTKHDSGSHTSFQSVGEWEQHYLPGLVAERDASSRSLDDEVQQAVTEVLSDTVSGRNRPRRRGTAVTPQ